MTTRYVFAPHQVADKCTLWEALHWVSFNIYPLFEYSDNCDDAREDLERNDNLELERPPDFEAFFTKDICEKYELPISTKAEYIDQFGDYPSFGYPQDVIDRFIATGNMSDDEIQTMLSDSQKQKEFDIKQKLFDDSLDNFLEQYKATLFIALKNGNVRAYGRNLVKTAHILEIDIENEIDIDEIWGNASNDDTEFEEISKKDWYINSIEWEDSYFVNGNKSAFCHILVDVESLFTAFPASEQQTKSVISVNGVFLDSNQHINNKIKTGRPSYNWHSFHEEMAYRLLKGKLPKLQKTCVIEMGEWCFREWKALPSETNLKNNISPFYAAMKKSETI